MTNRKDLNFWVYDFEVFKHDWCVTFQSVWNESDIRTFINDRDAVLAFLEEQDDIILIGYNNGHYDDWILHGLKLGVDLYRLSNFIVEQHGQGHIYPPFKGKPKRIVSYDLIKDMSLGGMVSLKQLESDLGYKVYESTIPFDLDRKLNEGELAETVKYNIYDVYVTLELFKKYGDRIDAHIALVEQYNLKVWDLNRTGAQKAALIFKAQPMPRYETFKYEVPESMRDKLDPELVDFYENQIYVSEGINSLSRKITRPNHGNEIDYQFGVGGLHAALDNFHYHGEIWNVDVASFYPNLMINYNYISRACPGGVKQLKEITEQRLKYKAEGHILNNAIKLIIVAIYGNMAYKFSLMWDKKQQTSICITGQLFLYYLVQLLEPYATIIQVNTDGVMIIPHDKDECKRVIKQWEEETLLTLELDTGTSIYQKDVNNYIFLHKPVSEFNPYNKEEAKKYVKCKGGMTRFWNYQIYLPEFHEVLDRIANNNSILDEALVRYFIQDKPLEETIRSCNDPLRFVHTVKLQGKYTQFRLGEKFIPGKVFRIFAVKGEGDQPYKCYDKDGEWKKEKFASTSPCSIVLNDDIRGKDFNELGVDIDYDYYIDLAKTMVKHYNG